MPCADNVLNRKILVIDSASRHARMIYYLYLGFIAYCAVTVFSTTDRQLAIRSENAQLPILDIEVPLNGFFIVAPIILVVLFIYFMLYLHRIDQLINKLSHSFDKNDLYPWMFNIARKPDSGIIGVLQKLFVSFTLWFTLPIILLVFAFSMLKVHYTYLSFYIVTLAIISIYISYLFCITFNLKHRQSDLIQVAHPIIISVLIFTAWYGTMILIPDVNNGNREWANLNLKNEVLVKTTQNNEDFQTAYWGDFEGVNWNGAELRGATLKRANLTNASLKNANLELSDFSSTNLSGADLSYANLSNSTFREANFNETLLIRAFALNTNFEKSNFSNADFKKSILQRVNFRNSLMIYTNFNGAVASYSNFSVANLQGSTFIDADLTKTDFNGSNLNAVNFKGANLSNTFFNNSGCTNTNFKEALFVNMSQLCKASVLVFSHFDDKLKLQIEDPNIGCPQLQTTQSLQDWSRSQFDAMPKGYQEFMIDMRKFDTDPK